jgi:ATP/maltotriose-dependent transcriptional regulator MalT
MSANPILEQCLDAMIEFQKLRPVLAGRLAEEALQIAREHLGGDSSATLLPATVLAQSLYEQGRLDEADNLLRFRTAAIRSSDSLECVARAYGVLARTSMHTGHPEFAMSLLRDARAVGERRHWPELVAIMTAECAQLLLEAADIAAAQKSCGDLAVLIERSAAIPAALQHALRMRLAFTESRIAIARGCYPEALEGLTQLHEQQLPENSNALWTLQLQLQLAACHARSDSIHRARELLAGALKTGAGNGLCMTFIDAGQVVRDLIAELCREGRAADARIADLLPYIRSLLRHFDRTTATGSSKRPSTEVKQSLTRRESGILELIAGGLSNKRIAQRLDITPETVKSHAKNIFYKLAAQTRAQAVARAEALGII